MSDKLSAAEMLMETIQQYNKNVNDVSKFKFNQTEIELFADMMERYASQPSNVVEGDVEKDDLIIRLEEKTKKCSEWARAVNELAFQRNTLLKQIEHLKAQLQSTADVVGGIDWEGLEKEFLRHCTKQIGWPESYQQIKDTYINDPLHLIFWLKTNLPKYSTAPVSDTKVVECYEDWEKSFVDFCMVKLKVDVKEIYEIIDWLKKTTLTINK